MTASGFPPVVLMATGNSRARESGLDSDRYRLLTVSSGTLACQWARDLRPDVVMLDEDLEDMTGTDACRALRADLRVGHQVPIVILTAGPPTPAERIAALKAGAWDCLEAPRDADALALSAETYLEARRSLDVALGRGLFDATTGLYNRPGLARRARELGAVMARTHSAFACLVFVPSNGSLDTHTALTLARNVRTSDIVGLLSAKELAVLAPGTGSAGAVRLAQRLVEGLDRTPRVGYDAVANLGYTPVDPTELMVNAAAAVKRGVPDTGTPWVLRFDSDRVSGGFARRRPSPAPIISTERKERS